MVRLVPPLGFNVKSTPLPVRESTWGELAALSVTVSAPERGPPTVGAKAICIVQAVLTATIAPQVLLPGVMTKSPLIPMLWTVRGTPPLFVSVTVCAADVMPTPVAAKVTVEKGDRDTPGGAIPMPVRLTVCVRYWSATVNWPLIIPTFFGWKATFMEQVECGLRELPHALTTVKSPLVICATINVNGRSPVLVTAIC